MPLTTRGLDTTTDPSGSEIFNPSNSVVRNHPIDHLSTAIRGPFSRALMRSSTYFRPCSFEIHMGNKKNATVNVTNAPAATSPARRRIIIHRFPTGLSVIDFETGV